MDTELLHQVIKKNADLIVSEINTLSDKYFIRPDIVQEIYTAGMNAMEKAYIDFNILKTKK